MQIRAKFILSISVVVVISYGITFYRTSSFQERLVVAQGAHQARMLYEQLRMTRQWIADHNGLFLLKERGVEANPFLPDAEIRTSDGKVLVKRNPAMVTRELSLYAAREGYGQFAVTSLHPINPANRPDAFEERSLRRFERGVVEMMEIEQVGGVERLRYIAPLVVEPACLECHARQGYKVGDIRGGLSVTIPMEWAFASIHQNNRMLLVIAIATICVVSLTLFLLFESLVARRIRVLEREMEAYPEHMETPPALPATTGDEIGRLTGKFRELCLRLKTSQEELDRAREQVFQGEKLAALGRLVAGVGHEINNPLAGMMNCVKSMTEAPDDVEQTRRYLPLLTKGLDRIRHTVRQLLNFGRREPLQRQEAEVDELVRECFELLGYGLKNIDLELDLGLTRPLPVDKEALKQVIMNIGLNGIQAMPGGGSLTVTTFETGGMIRLVFRDTGGGIAPEHLQKIFDPFFTTKDIGEGTGLGLSVSYSLVKRMGGSIKVESETGRGSTFVVELPAHDDEEQGRGNKP